MVASATVVPYGAQARDRVVRSRRKHFDLLRLARRKNSARFVIAVAARSNDKQLGITKLKVLITKSADDADGARDV